MENILQFVCELGLLVTVIFMNITRKNTGVIAIYAIQSLTLAVLLGSQAYWQHDVTLGLLASSIVIVKVIVIPTIFLRFIHRRHQQISTGTYLSGSLTLAVLLLLVIFVQSGVFAPASLHMSSSVLLLINCGLMSLFMAINRKGAILQIVGILSLENSIFAMGHFLNPGMSGSLELGILFDTLFWAIIAGIYIRLVYNHHRSLDTAQLRELKQ